MASRIEKTQLRLQFDAGEVDGKQKYKNKTFSNIKHSASNEDLLVVSNSINTLSEKNILITQKVVTSVLE